MLDYTEQELQSVQQMLNRRYKVEVEMHLADCEVQPDAESDARVERPALFWNALDCNFVVIKMAESQFQGFFFYQPDEQFSSAQQSYSDPVNCVIALLQNHADRVGEAQGYVSGATGADLD